LGSSGEAPLPSSSWQKCSLQESDIQDLVEHGLLPQKHISVWRCCYGEEFSSEDTDQTVLFKSFYEKGFALSAGAFFRGLLHFYGLEVTYLKPNSIAQIAIFIHLCEGYLGIAPHFKLWQVLYRLMGHPSNIRQNIVGGAAFSLRQGSVYPDFELRHTKKGWVREWFVVANPAPCLPARTGCAAEYKACWEEPPTSVEMVQVERLLKEITDLSAQGLMGAVVAISFCRRLTQPIQERVHPAFEYWGHQDPTRGHERKVPWEEIANRVARIMAGQIRDKGCPKAHSLKRPTDAVSFS